MTQQIYPYASNALLFVAGLLVVIFRKRFASEVDRRNRALRDSVPTLFPPPVKDRERLRLLAIQCLAVVGGIAFMGVSALELWKLAK